MEHYKQTPVRFAEQIGVQRSSISHILSGRNKPSYDFLLKIAGKYPEIDLNWLISGKGEMLKTIEPKPQNIQEAPLQHDLFSPPKSKEKVANNEVKSEEPPMYTNVNIKQEGAQTNQGYICKPIIEGIFVVYSDGSFKNYRPKGEELL